MRTFWILSIFPILLSAGLLMVIMGQLKETEMINVRNEEMMLIAKKMYNNLQYETTFKQSLEQLVSKGGKTRDELDAAVVNLQPQLETKKKDNNACQAEVKTKKEEVVSTEETQKKTTETLNAESDVWKKEIDTLKATLTGISPVCEYLRNKTKDLALCVKAKTS